MEKKVEILDSEVKDENKRISLLEPKIKTIKETCSSYDIFMEEKANQLHICRMERDKSQEQFHKSKFSAKS